MDVFRRYPWITLGDITYFPCPADRVRAPADLQVWVDDVLWMTYRGSASFRSDELWAAVFPERTPDEEVWFNPDQPPAVPRYSGWQVTVGPGAPSGVLTDNLHQELFAWPEPPPVER